MQKTIKDIITFFLILSISIGMLIPAYAGDVSKPQVQASALKQLRLFKGVSATDFDLDRPPTRTEALAMLIRVLGKETEAATGDWTHPFTDVADWADKYVGYAYENGLTKGVSATEFGADNANSNMYLTFVLRALGYDDSAGDFAWDEPGILAESVGILSGGVNTAEFMRADVVLISWAALEAKLKDGSQTLSEKLIGAGVFTSENYSAAKQYEAGNGGITVSTLSELQAAAENADVTVVQIGSDMDISNELTVERDHNFMIYIKEGTVVTVSGTFIPVFCDIVNDGEMVINGSFDHASNFINNGLVTVKNSGTASSGMTSIYNYGTFNVEAEGKLLIERGTQFHNLGMLTNDGYISISDGGGMDSQNGTIVNNNTIDLDSYFSGDIADITGSGTLNDKRN